MTESLEVEYGGDWEEDVEEHVRSVEDDVSVDDADAQSDELRTRLVLELPEAAPIVEIERTDRP